MNYSRSNFTLIVCDLKFLSQSRSWILFLYSIPLQLIRAIVHNDHQKIIFLFVSVWLKKKTVLIFRPIYVLLKMKWTFWALPDSIRIAWKSGRKLILKFSPQADFNFVQPWNGHSRKLAQLSMTIFSKFWSRDHYPICIHGFRSRCFTCIAEQVTSEVVDNVFSGRAAIGLSFREHKRRNGEICPFSCSASKAMFY